MFNEPEGTPPKLLWSMYFDGSMTLDTPTVRTTSPPGYYYVGNISNVDSHGHGVSTANAAFGVTGSAPTLEHQYILDGHATGDPILIPANLADEFTATVRPSTFKGGIGNEIEVTQVDRITAEWYESRPQMEVMLELNNSTQCIDELSGSKMVRIPSNILDILDRPAGGWTVAWMELDFVKFGPSTTNDARISIQLIKVQGETGLRMRAQLDNSGVDTLTGVNTGVIAGLDADKVIDYGQTAEGVVVPGKDYVIDWWLKRSAGREDLTTGRFQCDITRLDTEERFNVIDKSGGQFWGYYAHHAKRFAPVILYTGGYPSAGNISLVFSNIRYWNGKHCRMGA